MNTLVKEEGIQTVHDQVVSEVAQRWAKAFQCKVTIRTSSDSNPWADPGQQSDIAGWSFTPRGHCLQWLADVETEASLFDQGTHEKWRQAAMPGVPIYLLIPRGTRAVAEKISSSVDFQFSSIYEYSLINGIVQVL